MKITTEPDDPEGLISNSFQVYPEIFKRWRDQIEQSSSLRTGTFINTRQFVHIFPLFPPPRLPESCVGCDTNGSDLLRSEQKPRVCSPAARKRRAEVTSHALSVGDEVSAGSVRQLVKGFCFKNRRRHSRARAKRAC